MPNAQCPMPNAQSFDYLLVKIRWFFSGGLIRQQLQLKTEEKQSQAC